jgi:Domain of unknown function (DUF4349)
MRMTSSRTRRLRLAALVPLILGVLLMAAACSGSSDQASSSEDAGAADAPAAGLQDSVAGGAPAPAPGKREAAAAGSDGLSSGGDTASSGATGDAARPPVQTRAVISTGTVSYESDDVDETRFDVQQVVDGHRGEVTDEQSDTDDDGAMVRSRLVVRVPSAEFGAAMDELEKVAGLRTAKRSSEDVTTQVIDTDVRVRAQEESLQRVEALLARARSLRTIVAIESELTRRQAELDSLKAQQAYLADQTTLSTITVFLERTKQEPVAKKAEDDSGFVAGLSRGWHAFTTAASGAAEAVGTLLPFLVLLLLVGVPVWLVTRNVQRRHRAAAQTPAPAP